MNFNTDGFNERNNYIHNSNDLNRLRNNPNSFDNSFAKMRIEERKNMVETTNIDNEGIIEEVKGNKDKFIIRNNNMMNANAKPIPNNPVSNALNNNMFKR